MGTAPSDDLEEAKRRGSELLIAVARACPDEIDPRPIVRVATFLAPPARRPTQEELIAYGAPANDAIESEMASAFAAPGVDDLQYARDVLIQYVTSAESEPEGAGGVERREELMNLPHYQRCLAYLDDEIAARTAN